MMEPITVVIPGEPQGKGRPRFNGRSGVYTPAKTAAYESMVGVLARASMRGKPVLTGPLHIDLRAVIPIPKSWSKALRDAAITGDIRPTSKPDIDNIIKAVSDGMNKIVYADDAAIASVSANKVYGENPFVVVTVKPLKETSNV
ncbi:RusA family crossover junction endodeoxyribonuclease [Afipia carboxidovorans]|uniref:RusA family crossover junction endodeoxyribonuclease n=1 Tax=Afipia carboxidovorans TaxID=40137 RepID=UPI0030862B61|nr:RusA family crossover junction endodeoxyribonuclease [Afipia carboxidovorans]